MTISVERVKAGDLIRARDWNDLVDALVALDGRVSALENGPNGGSGDEPEIIDVEPDEPIARGTMTIIGRNFAVPASLNTVTLGDVPVTGILPGSTDQQLLVTVPGTLTGLPRNLLLEVQTAAGEASRMVRIRPEVVIPGGKPKVSDVTTGLGVIEVGKSYTFTFEIDAAAVTIPESYALQAIYTNVVGASEPAWQAGTTLLPAEILVAPGTPATVGVTVKVPTGATSASLTLRAKSVNNDPGSSQSSAPVAIVVGQDQPEQDVKLTLGAMQGLNLKTVDDPATGEKVIQVRHPATGSNPRQVNIPIVVTSPSAGTFAYEAEIAEPGTLWEVMRVAPASGPQVADAATTVNVVVRLSALPVLGTPPDSRTTLTVRATRQETTEPGQISGVLTVPIEGFTG